MALTNTLKTVLDQPVWEWARFAPTANQAVSAFATSDDGNDRYIYYFVANIFYRYDTITDTYMQLASPVTSNVSFSAMKYSKYNGNRGRVLSQVSTTKLKIPYISGGSMLANTTIKILDGAGKGQERIITSVDPEVIEDSGLPTTASTSVLTDNTKKWKVNQWVGYNCRVTYGTGYSQQRSILFNTVDTLYFADTYGSNYEPYDAFAFATGPVATAGSQSHFVITSQTVNLNSALTVNTDSTSRFMVQTGVIWLLSSLTTGSFYSLQMYDVANDVWMVKTATASLFPGALNESSLSIISETGGEFLTGTATAGANRTITDSSKSMTLDRYTNYQIRITGGTGMGQRRRIIANGTNYFEVAKKWDINPDVTSTYSIFADTEHIYMANNSNSAIMKYNVDYDLWTQSHLFDYGFVSNMTVQKNGTLPFNIASGVRSTGAITSVAINNGGSGYKIGDVLTVSGGGGTNGKVFVETISSTGQILSISLMRCGATYIVTTGAATTGGTGTLATINIVSVGTVCLVTTSMAHPFKIGDSITIKGCTEAAYNTTYTILGADGTSATIPTVLEFITTATANMINTSTVTTSLIVDPTANWDVNEHVGRSVNVYVGATSGSIQTRRIVSNTATTLTLSSAATSLAAATTRYAICEAEALGRDNQFQSTNQFGYGSATSGSTTTLVDSTKNWIPGSWTGYRVRIVAGTGLSNEIAITANTATTLTYATQTFTPDTTTRYRIMDSFGIATSGSTTTIVDTTKNWKVNQWAGKRVRLTGGGNQSLELTITSNSATALTFGATNVMDATIQYTILGIPARGAGLSLTWTYGNGNEEYLCSARGGGFNSFDIYNINTDTWEYGIFQSPQFETFTTGSMYAYDGGNRIYINHNITGRIYYFDISTRQLVNSGTVPYGHSTATIGNRMEIVNGPDNLKFLYVMRHSGQEMWRTLLFW